MTTIDKFRPMRVFKYEKRDKTKDTDQTLLFICLTLKIPICEDKKMYVMPFDRK